MQLIRLYHLSLSYMEIETYTKSTTLLLCTLAYTDTFVFISLVQGSQS